MSPTLFIKRFLPRTLFGRSLLIIVSPLILLQVIATHIFYDRHWDTITRRLSISIAGDVSMVLNMLSENQAPNKHAAIFDRARKTFGFIITMEPGVILPNKKSVPANARIDYFLSHALKNGLALGFRSIPRRLKSRSSSMSNSLTLFCMSSHRVTDCSVRRLTYLSCGWLGRL